MLDPQVGRWSNIDPLIETSEWLSGYVYGSNNPAGRFDPDGLKDKPFNSETDAPIKQIIGTATYIYIYNDKGQRIGFAPGYKNAYNCHSYAWEQSQGDPKDPANAELVKQGITKWDEDPANNILESGAVQLATDAANQVDDRVIYYVDANKDGKWEKGEQIEHSAIVTAVDKEGNTTLVTGKMGQEGISTNHPNAPGYYDKATVNDKTVSTSRAYFRIPRDKKKSSKKSTGSNAILTPPPISFIQRYNPPPIINKTSVRHDYPRFDGRAPRFPDSMKKPENY
jgi:hypothetical protein